jgi:acetyltransferase-like isoleucine patch superfamily enzyme
MLSINKIFWLCNSLFVKTILRLNGAKVGKKFYIEGMLKLKIRGKGINIEIGDNVSVFGNIDLRNRENGRITIGNNVKFDSNVRIVSARDGTIKIGEGSAIGPYTIINGGGNVMIGKKTIFAKNISINANDHEHKKLTNIMDQGFVYGDVIIEDDVWLGANVCINKGVTIKKGSIVGANAVVTKNTDLYSINAGVPSKKISERN